MGVRRRRDRSGSGAGVWAWILLDYPGCVGCGICADVCPDDAMMLTAEMAHPMPGSGACTGCGICVKECPMKTLRIRRTQPDAVSVGRGLASGEA